MSMSVLMLPSCSPSSVDNYCYIIVLYMVYSYSSRVDPNIVHLKWMSPSCSMFWFSSSSHHFSSAHFPTTALGGRTWFWAKNEIEARSPPTYVISSQTLCFFQIVYPEPFRIQNSVSSLFWRNLMVLFVNCYASSFLNFFPKRSFVVIFLVSNRMIFVGVDHNYSIASPSVTMYLLTEQSLLLSFCII